MAFNKTRLNIKLVKICIQCLLFITLSTLSADLYAHATIYLFIDSGHLRQYKKQLNVTGIEGAQLLYTWKSLEPKKGHYDFTQIEKDLRTAESLHKSLFIQIQDKSFSPHIINVPNYLLSPHYDDGIAKQSDFSGEGKPLGSGWVAKQWVPAVQLRFQKLLQALGKRFDGRIAGINLTETAIDLNSKKYPPFFTCNKYFRSVLNNMNVLRSSFNKSYVVQYVNFFPCEWDNDHQYMSHLFDYAYKHQIGLGGPDVAPYRRGQMKNSYPYFHRYKDKLPLVAFAIQEPDYTYINSKTKKHFSIQELYGFANHYLGAKIIFWNMQEPQFSQSLLPFIAKKHL